MKFPKIKIPKYRNIKTKIDGILFDSKREAAEYRRLKQLLGEGKIFDLQIQPRYDLVVNNVKCGFYKADFRYIENGELILSDVKSKPTMTAIYRLKKKLIFALYGIKITEIL